MKLAVFYPYSPFAGCAWSVAGGIVKTLNLMGHEATAYRVTEKSRLPNVSELRKYDGIIVSGIEWISPRLREEYGAVWSRIFVPKAAMYHESNDRDDRCFHFEQYLGDADYHFYPAIQDAEKFDGYWLPFGVDTTVFYPTDRPKDIEVGFVGNVYGKRQEFLNQLGEGVVTVLSNVGYGLDEEDAAKALADAYRRIKVFVNLPSLSRLIVTKIYEVMACGTALVTPPHYGCSTVSHSAMYYDGGEDLRNTLISLKEQEYTKERLGKSGAHLAANYHRLDQRLEIVIEAFKKWNN